MVCRWMIGWLVGLDDWVVGWMDDCVVGWMDDCVVVWMDEWMDLH